MTLAPTISLNDGNAMPQLGLGVWQAPADSTADIVRTAVVAGYRSIDTAQRYLNEAGVGEGVNTAVVPRDQIFVTTKLANQDHSRGYDQTLRAFDESLRRMGLEYIDLYLIHWPQPEVGKYLDCWRALTRLQSEGRTHSIGVCNFYPEHLQRLIDATGVAPAVNQVELHPRFQQAELRTVHAQLGVATESWSPLGQGSLLNERVVAEVALKHGRTSAQVVLRWHIELGLITIPRSKSPSRIVENFSVWDFRLDAQDMAAFGRLDEPSGRVGPDPLTINVR